MTEARDANPQQVSSEGPASEAQEPPGQGPAARPTRHIWPARLDLRQTAKRAVQQAQSAIRPPSPDRFDDRNAYFLVREVISTGLLSSATAFGSNFAVRLGASNLLIGLLNAGPALVVVLLTLPMARFLETRQDRVPWVVGGRGVQRAMFILIAIMPFFLPREYLAPAFVIITLLRQVALSPQNAGWTALLAEMVPERRRTQLVANRSIYSSAVTIIATPLLGRLLDNFVFPYGYQIAYSIAFVAGMIGTYDLLQLREPRKSAEERAKTTERLREKGRLSLKTLPAMVAANRPFFRILLNTFVPNIGAWIASPLFTIHYLRNLNASDAWVGTLTSVASLSLLAGTYFWRRYAPQWGEYRVLRVLMPLLAFYPLVVSFSPSLTPILLAAVVQNLVLAGTNLAHFNTLLKVAPVEQRTTYLSVYTTVMNIGAFAAPMFGTLLADKVSIPSVMLAVAAIRCAGGALFALRPVVRVEREAVAAEGVALARE